MRYLCLVYPEDGRAQAQSEDELRRCIDEQTAYFHELKDKGQAIAAHNLQPPQSATCLRVRDGRLSMTDGPFAETSEHLGGFFLIEARDLNEAVRIAGGIPAARFSCVEVRPLTSWKKEPA